MDSLSQALWQYALEERKLEVQRLQRVQQRMQLEEQRLQREQPLEMQRIQLEQQYEDQCRQSEFEEVIDLCSLFVPVPKPRTGIKSGIGKKETQPDNVVSDKCRFVPVPKPRTSIKPGDGRREAQPGIVVPERLSVRTASQYADSQGERPVPAPRPVPRRCYLCNSPTHLASDCPQKSSYRGYTPKPVPRPQVNFCKTKQKLDPPKQSKDGSCVLRDRSTGGSVEPTCSNCKPVSGSEVHFENSCQSSAASVVAPKRDSAVNHMVLAEETTEFGAIQDQVEPVDKNGIEGSHVDTEIPADEILQDGWSCLKYIEVDVDGLSDTVIALN